VEVTGSELCLVVCLDSSGTESSGSAGSTRELVNSFAGTFNISGNVMMESKVGIRKNAVICVLSSSKFLWQENSVLLWHPQK